MQAAYQLVDTVINKGKTSPAQTKEATISPNVDKDHPMRAVAWSGKAQMSVIEAPRPLITDPQDVILRLTATAICGSDLHMYLNGVPGMEKGDIMGHEFMGYVEQVGPGVKTLQAGDRVVACFDIACGGCKPCQRQEFSCCDSTNSNTEQRTLYGHNTAGIFGYSHMTGGWPGGQAEFARVPFADLNCLKLPPAEQIPDEKVLFLSDILPTAWHANEMGRVGPGDNVAIWGSGPVGMLAAHCAQYRGANKVVLIDKQPYRLEYAKQHLPGVETIDCSKANTLHALDAIFPGGPDVGIEAVGFHYSDSLIHKLQRATMLETDTPEILNQIITGVRKGGRISIVGVYVGTVNGFNIGAFMEKGQSMAGGQTPVQKYWGDLYRKVLAGHLHPEMVITHQLPLEQAGQGYKIFNDKLDGCMKVVLRPLHGGGAPSEAASTKDVSAVPDALRKLTG